MCKGRLEDEVEGGGRGGSEGYGKTREKAGRGREIDTSRAYNYY